MNIPEKNISTTSSHKLCQQTGMLAVSDENRELMYKELERRGQTCTSNNAYRPPPPKQNTTQPLSLPKSTQTTCNKVGGTLYCNTQ